MKRTIVFLFLGYPWLQIINKKGKIVNSPIIDIYIYLSRIDGTTALTLQVINSQKMNFKSSLTRSF